MKKEVKQNFKEQIDISIFTESINQKYISVFPVLLQRLGCQEGLVLNLLLHRQHFLHTKSKSRHKCLFMSCKQIGNELGIEEQLIHDILTWLRNIGIIFTVKRGAPPINNFYFDLHRILDVIKGPDLKRVRGTRSSKKTKNIVI